MPNPKQPQDHQTKAKVKPQPNEDGSYTWTSSDGETVELSAFDRMPAGVFRKARDLDEMSMTFVLLEAGTNAEGLEVIDRLPIGELENLFSDWSEAGGITGPESLRSTA